MDGDPRRGGMREPHRYRVRSRRRVRPEHRDDLGNRVLGLAALAQPVGAETVERHDDAAVPPRLRAQRVHSGPSGAVADLMLERLTDGPAGLCEKADRTAGVALGTASRAYREARI